MRNIGKICLAAAMACALLLVGCSGSSSNDNAGSSEGSQPEAAQGNVLRVGVREAISNFGYFNEMTGKFSGLEIDIADELAARLGYSGVEYVGLHSEDRERALESGEVDCVIATMTITDERQKKYDFSPSYYQDQRSIMVQTSTGFTKLDDLSGATVGIVTGAAAETMLPGIMEERGLEPVTFVTETLYEDLSDLLEVGTVDALCLDGCVARTYMNEDRAILDEDLGEVDYGVATMKGSDLSSPIAQAIQDMLDDGTIAALIDKWN